MGAGLSKRSTNGGVERRHSWAAQGTPRTLSKSFGGSFKQLRCITHEFGSQNKCHSENYLKQKGTGAVVGLHSNWVGDFILACARPSRRIIQDHHLIDQFKRQHIGAIINLQEPGEHAGCGDGVDPESGFSYNPEHFEQENILYFNFPWQSSNFMDEKLALVICQTMGTQIATGAKVAVHCHSGMDRTGLVVACYLLYSRARDSPMQAIQDVRENRPGTFKSKSQVELVKRFASYVVNLRIQFVPPDQRRKNLTGRGVKSYPTLVETMVRQNLLLYGVERRALHYVPKVLDWLTRDFIRRTEFNRDKREQIAIAFIEAFTTDLNLSPDDEAVQDTKARVNVGDWRGIEELETSVLCHLLLDWLYQLQEPIVPDSILTTALGRGDIESAVEELSKCDECSFATLQCLVCWMFQMVPVQPKLIRQLYSALAHVLLASTTLQLDRQHPYMSPKQGSSPDRSPFVARLSTVNWVQSVYSKFKPSSLEIEFGFMLEATARFWIKLGVARREEIETKSKDIAASTSPGPSTGPLPSSFGVVAMKLRDRHQLGSFSQPWFRDRASLHYEQYNPGLALEHQEELEGRSSNPPFHTSTKSQKPEAVGTRKGEQKHKNVGQGDKQPKAVNPKEQKSPLSQSEKRNLAPDQSPENPDAHINQKPVEPNESKKPAHLATNEKAVVSPETKKPVKSTVENRNPMKIETPKIIKPSDHETKNPIAPAQKKPVVQEEKKHAAHEAKSKPVALQAQKKSGPYKK